VKVGTSFPLASALGITGQFGYASELAPYVNQIQQIIGVPEPSGAVLAALGFALLLAARRRPRNR
jgi:MYXO-CTERM domain-containing protein